MVKKHSRTQILVDSDAFVALLKIDDTNHHRAVALFDELEKQPVEFVTTNYVIAETVTVVSQRIGHDVAIAFIDTHRGTESSITTIQIDAIVHDQALDLFRKQSSKNTSLVDCTNMALLENNTASYIFSFDKAYKKNGYPTAEALIE